jgi:hypothetical protein
LLDPLKVRISEIDKQKQLNFERERQKEQQEYQRSRDALQDARYDKQELRKDQEQKATDLFYDSMSKGPQSVGGLYGDMLTKESGKHVMTQAEIASGIMDPAKARASGNESLAKKLEWQLDAGETANKAVESDAFKESRPEMYLRMMDENRSKGLPILPGMVEKYESAKLAEETANAKKLEDITKLKEDIYKDQLSNSKFLIGTVPNKNGEVQVGVDSDGNPTYMPTLKEQVRDQNKANETVDKKITKGTSLINSTLSNFEKDNKVTFKEDQKNAITEQMNKLFRDEVAKNPNIDPDLISQAVSEAAKKKDVGLILTNNQPAINMTKFEADVKNSILNQSMADKIKAQQQVALQNSGTYGQNMPSKFDMAKELVSGTNAVNANRLAGINSKMAQLNMTPEKRRVAKAQEWLRSEGLMEQEKKDRFEEFNPKNRLSFSGKNSSEIGFKNAVAEVESGGDYNAVNKDSNAKGKYQFVDSTLNGLIKQSGNNHTIDQVIKSPELQEYYFDKLTVSNKNDLINRGVQPNDFNMWLAHNLGPAQAENFLSGEPLTKSTIRAIDANVGSGFAPTRENYLNKFGSKFAGAPKEIKSYDDDTSVAQKDSKIVDGFNSIPEKINAEQIFVDNINQPANNQSVQTVGSLTDEQIALAKPIPSLTIEPEKQKTGFQILGGGAKTGINETYKQATGALRDLVMPAVQGVENIFGSNKTAKAGLALANNTAAGMNEILFSPYTVTKAGTDWLYTGKAEKGMFTKQAEDARATAISALKDAGVENPTSQEILMIMSDALAPIAGASKAVSSGIKTGARELNNLPNASDLEFLVSKSNRLPAPLTQGVPNVSSKTDVALGSEISKKLEGLNVKSSDPDISTYVNKSTPDYFTNLRAELDVKDSLDSYAKRRNRIDQQNVVESAINTAAQDFKSGKISEQEFRKFLKDTNDSGLINTRQMLEKVESIIGK